MYINLFLLFERGKETLLGRDFLSFAGGKPPSVREEMKARR